VAELAHLDWAGRDLTGEVHAGDTLVDVDLSEVVGSGASFTDCVLRDCSLNAAVLVSWAFTGCTFTGCSLFDTRLVGCKLVGSTFARCRFDLLSAEGGDWSFTGLASADLRRTSLTDVRMREADLRKARLQEVTWHRVDLSGSDLTGADLSGADLRGSDLSSLDPRTTAVVGAVVDLQQALTVARALGLDVRGDEGPPARAG